MRNLIATLILSIALAPLAACQEKSQPAQSTENSPAPAAAPAKASAAVEAKHAPATVVPGSYEDWCGEHGVAESQCTRCNPSLIAAFKATTDWCAEHNLPESQCKICNPDLKIERPQKKGP